MSLLKKIISWSPAANIKEKKEHEKAVRKLVEVIRRQHTLYRKEIKQWRMAQFHAKNPEMPRRTMLIDLYEEIIDDAFIFGRAETRKLRVSNKDFVIKTNDEIDTEKTKLLQKGWFSDFIKLTIDSIYYGYSLIFIDQLDEDGYIKSIDQVFREHIVPEKCELLKNVEDLKGINFTEPPYSYDSVWINNKHSLGLLNKAAPLYIFKKHSWQNWDEFEEKFGIPMRIIKTASTDPKVLKEIDKWLKELGSAAQGRFPQGTEIEIKETSTTDSFNVFNQKRKACNEELATLFDGHFETATDSGSRAKSSSLIESTQDLITLDDAMFVKNIINDLLLPILIEKGYPFTEDDVFDWNENTKLSPKERLAIFEGVQKLGHKVKKKQIESELDVELEDEQPPEPPSNEPNNGFANFNMPHSSHSCGAHPNEYRIAVYNNNYDLSEDEKRLLNAIVNGNINWDYKEFKHTHNQLLKALREGAGAIQTSYDDDSHKMLASMKASVHRFGFDKTVAEIWQLNEILNTSANFEEFRNRALKLFPNYKLHWLKTEYQQAFATSQMGARWQQMLADIDIAPFWRYSAILDDKVRPEHKALHNKVFRKDDAEASRFLPPIGYNCRCDALEELESFNGQISDISDAINSDPNLWEQMQKTGHDVNWGDAGQVFSSNQSYLRKVRANNVDYSDLNASDFNLPNTVKSNLNYNETPLQWLKKLDVNDNLKIFDVNNHPVWVNKSILENSPEFAVNQLHDILTNPDEVYHFAEGSNMVNKYIKYYKQNHIAVRVDFNRNTSSFVSAIEADSNIENLRNGLLIHYKPDHIAFERSIYEQAQKQFDLRAERSFDENTGGWFITEANLGKNDFRKTIPVAEKFHKHGFRIVIKKEAGNKKSYDVLMNDVPFEFKLKENYQNLAGSIHDELKRAVKQSRNIAIALDSFYNADEIVKGLEQFFARKERLKKVDNIYILVKNDNLIKISIKEFVNKSYKKFL